MQMEKRAERIPALLKLAKRLGVSTHYLVNPDTGKHNEPELLDRIRKIEQHNDTKRTAIIVIIFTIFTAYFGWGWVYSTFIFPPKYKIETKLYRDYLML